MLGRQPADRLVIDPDGAQQRLARHAADEQDRNLVIRPVDNTQRFRSVRRGWPPGSGIATTGPERRPAMH
jgi:hypothetical protein